MEGVGDYGVQYECLRHDCGMAFELKLLYSGYTVRLTYSDRVFSTTLIHSLRPPATV